jgi:OmpA family protein/WD40 repeat protein/tetratricopeptide repeat protein
MRNFVLIILLIVNAFNYSLAQDYDFTSKSKKAVKYYNSGASNYTNRNYNGAIEDLEKSLQYDSEFIEAWLLLGDILTDVSRFDDAIAAYKSALSIDSTFFPPVYYFLANIYYSSGKYSNAAECYNNLLSFNSISEELIALATKKILFAETSARLVSNPVSSVPKNLGSKVNTNNDEYINYVNTNEDLLMLTKRTKHSEYSSSMYVEQLYNAEKVDTAWITPMPIDLNWKGDRNMGTINFSTDGRTMYFTGCYWPKGYGGCDLYYSNSSGNRWLNPVNMGRKINTTTWESQPIISSDGKKLYFASKRPGGKGGSDIWMSLKLKDNSWSPPVNLGDSINTSDDEMAPFLHADGSTLFFASKGHPGLGGYDLFVSRADEFGRWSLAKNIGYPTNSRYNEINIFSSIDGLKSWISSDRHDGYGKFDIYSFDNYKEVAPVKVMYVEGLILDKITGEPLKAKVEITNLNNYEVINNTVSDSVSGAFLIVVYPGIDYAFNITKDGYLFLSENINLKDSIGIESVKKKFMLSKIATGNQLVMNNVFFQFNSHDLLQSSYYELDKLSELLISCPMYMVEIAGHTDNVGNPDYNMELSRKRAVSVGEYLINEGVDSKRLSYVAKGATSPVASNETENGRAKNRRTEILLK